MSTFTLSYFLPKTNVLCYFQAKQPEELETLMEAVTDVMETAASTADLSTARQSLLHSVERLTESLAAPAPPEGRPDTGRTRV